MEILIDASLHGVAPRGRRLCSELARLRGLGLVRADDAGQHLLTDSGKELLRRAIHREDEPRLADGRASTRQ